MDKEKPKSKSKKFISNDLNYDKKRSSSSEKKLSKRQYLGNITAFCNIAIAVGTLILVFYTIKQVNFSILFAEKTIALADSSMKLDHRPWVIFQKIIPDSYNIDSMSEGSVWIDNYGKTPAIDLDLVVGMFYDSVFEITRLPLDGEDNVSFKSKAIIPPSRPSQIVCNDFSFLSPERRKKILQKKGWLFVYGVITYTDVFKGHDTTVFCQVYDVDSRSFVFFKKFNTAK
ncbi:MAG: hypothetical protein HY960_00840 [Ignavibacteriae bacterium]|nr:hypothetical protein [Ignavibacteriota bacterium]